MYLRRVFAEIQFVLFTCLWREVTETEPGRERTLFILFILEKHIISLLLWLYRNKSRPFAVSNDTLFLSVRSKLTRVFLVLFAVIKKIRDSPYWCGLRPQGKPIRDRVGRVQSCHCQQGKKTLQVAWHRWLADPTIFLQIYTIHVNDPFQGENGEFRRKVTSLHSWFSVYICIF